MAANPVVHIVDDDEAVRRSLAFMLGSAGLAVRVYESARAFLDCLDDVQCGCLVTDIRMPEMTGIELLSEIRERTPYLPAIVITGHGDVKLAVEAMKAGAIDFIEKPFDEGAILDAVKAALEQGGEETDEDLQAVTERIASLSVRERQVLEGLIAGQANKVIANVHGISPRTVEVYRANLMAKMQARSLSELIRMALLAQVPASPGRTMR
ncbi:MAG: response regulator FixJ [Methyloceanibacter sp.]